MINNILSQIPIDSKEEVFQDILSLKNVKIERIISNGNITPPDAPYLQEQAEWVLVLKGEAEVLFCETGTYHRLKPGDYLYIPANCSHRVTYTSLEEATIWLAVHIL